ncbi:hypothetical protein ACHAP5_009787 [Fusarium lateritium]
MTTTISKEERSEPQVIADDEKIESTSNAPTLHEPAQDEPRTKPEDGEITTEEEEHEWVTGWKLASMMTSLTLVVFLMLLDMSIISTWSFLVLFFVFEVGSLICGVAQSSTMLIIGRAVAGIGSSGIQNGALTIIASAVPIHKRPSLVGILMGCAQLGIVSGPLLGGAFTEYTTWRWYAMIPLDIIRIRQVWTACLTQLFLFATVLVASFYYPVYFQSVKDASPFKSGVNLLPSILTLILAAVSSGVLVQKVGYYLPFASASAVLSAIGFGLASTMGPYTSTATWAGYQVLVGFGRGIGLQMSIIAVQANTTPEVTPIAMAILTFSQVFGGAIFVTAANVIFTHELRNELMARLPNVDTESIINAGAGAVGEVVSRSQLPEVLWSYSKGVRATFLLAVAASCVMFFMSFGMGWKDIRKKPAVKAGEA